MSAKRASRDFGRRQRARSEELFSKNMLSSQERDQARTEALIAELELRQAEAQKRIEALELEQAQRRLEQRELRSPIRGVVVERLVAPGESVDDRPVFQLAQLDPLNVEVIVPVSDYGVIQPGMTVEVIPEAPLDNQRYRAEVKIIDRVVDAASGTFGVRLELPNPDYRLPAGLRCRVEFIAR